VTHRLIGDFVPILGSKFFGVRGPKSKIEEKLFVEGVVEN